LVNPAIPIFVGLQLQRNSAILASMLMISKQTRALLLVAMLFAAHAERDERMFSANKKLQQHVLQAQPDKRPGFALNEEVAKIGENMSQVSRACNEVKFPRRVNDITTFLANPDHGRGKLKGFKLAELANYFRKLVRSVKEGCTLDKLQNQEWQKLKEAVQTLAPPDVTLPTGEQFLAAVSGKNIAVLVANSFSLAMSGKLWNEMYPDTAVPGLEGDAVETTEEDVVQAEENLTKWYQFSVQPKGSLLESGSNTSQLVSSKWHPLSFVGGVIFGLIALVVSLTCALLNVLNALTMAAINGIFGSIYCLIKAAVQAREDDPQGFIPCMKTNAIVKVFKVVWRCNVACGVWSLKFSQDMFLAAFNTEADRGGMVDEDPPTCIQK